MPAAMRSQTIFDRPGVVRVYSSDDVEDVVYKFAPDPTESVITTKSTSERGVYVLEQLTERYVAAALRRVFVEMTEEGRFFLTVPILGDVWAEDLTEEGAMAKLIDVVRQWLLMKIEDHDRDLPVFGTLDLNWL